MNNFDRSRLKQIFVDALSDYGIVMLDTEGVIQSWNSGAKSMLGYSAADVVERAFSVLYADSGLAAERLQQDLVQAEALDQLHTTVPLLHKNASIHEVGETLVALRDAQRLLIGYGCLLQSLALESHDGAPPSRAGTPPSQRKILVVDDDEAVRRLAASQIASLGYIVVTAEDGAKALEILEHNSDFDLLFTDVSMPGGMGGHELAIKATQLRPTLKILFASGYFEGALAARGDIAAKAPFVTKPYRKKDLAEQLTKMLGD
jgi:PAS domain S-box-containing protein